MYQNYPIKYIFTLLLLATFNACTEKRKEAVAVIVKEIIFDSIPSGSGLELDKDSIFIVGDDAAYIYQVSLKDNAYQKIPLHAGAPTLYRIDKESKPDYEAATMITYHEGKYLLAFGSGSKSPERDSLVIVDVTLRRVDTVIAIKPFYDHLMQVSKTDKAAFNIEGVAVINERLVLLNRGNNMVYSFNAEKFIEYVLTNGTPPPLIYFRASLPVIEKFEARLSGAAAVGNDLLICASVEQTADWTKDGPVSGSFIGLMDEGEKEILLTAMLIYPNGKTALDKIESVVLLRKETNGDLIILALADNDDGKTKLMEIRITEKKS